MDNHKQDSVPRPRSRAIVPQQARVQVRHKGIKRLSSSSELGAQYVSPHQTTIKRKKTTPESRVPAWFLCHGMMQCDCKSCCEKREVSECSAQLHTRRTAFHRGSQGTAGTAGLLKRLTNRKANCFTLLKRITKLKCVNSEVNSVDIDPKQGCLNWPYGTMSESP